MVLASLAALLSVSVATTAEPVAGVLSPQAVSSAPSSAPAAAEPSLGEIAVTAPEPRYVAPTLRDRLGRIWAPVYLNGKGPFRLVLDTGASSSAIISESRDGSGPVARAARSCCMGSPAPRRCPL